ncbi:MAG: hypothetical protein U9R41_06685 [Candidatus Marinimicrobia bacterium]|nr:hypothetical protein [Candidatus Neomarinimicrobiota bacterium]
MKNKKENPFDFHPVLKEMKYDSLDEINVEFVQEYLRKQRRKNKIFMVFQIFLWLVVAMNFLSHHSPSEFTFYLGFLGIIMIPVVIVAYKRLRKRYLMEDEEIEKVIKNVGL